MNPFIIVGSHCGGRQFGMLMEIRAGAGTPRAEWFISLSSPNTCRYHGDQHSPQPLLTPLDPPTADDNWHWHPWFTPTASCIWSVNVTSWSTDTDIHPCQQGLGFKPEPWFREGIFDRSMTWSLWIWIDIILIWIWIDLTTNNAMIVFCW